MPAILLYGGAFLLYAALAFHFWRTRWRGASVPKISPLERAAIVAPFALHTWLVYDVLWGQSELRFGFGQALSVMLWLAVLIYWVESMFLELEGMQAPILALAALCAPLPALFPGLASPPYTHSTEFRLHLALAMIAYGMFTLAALHALLMTLMERRLHGGAIVGPLAALPPLLGAPRRPPSLRLARAHRIALDARRIPCAAPRLCGQPLRARGDPAARSRISYTAVPVTR